MTLTQIRKRQAEKDAKRERHNHKATVRRIADKLCTILREENGKAGTHSWPGLAWFDAEAVRLLAVYSHLQEPGRTSAILAAFKRGD